MTEIATDSLSDSPAVNAPASGWLDAIYTKLSRFQRLAVIIAVLAQFTVLCGMIALQMIPHASGTIVWLKVLPVDPRDMFRGDYVILSYEMSRVPSEISTSRPPGDLTSTRTVYVTLVPDADGKHHKAGPYLLERPASGIYLTGQETSWGRLEFGIESYYVQAGTGTEYEDAFRNGTLSAEVAVSPDGRAGLKSLQINR